MLRKLPQALWILGTIVIVLSWVKIVPNKIGWIGFGVALTGTLLGTFCRKSPPAAAAAPASPSVAAQLDELSRLRDRGDVTEEEFLRRKKALLGE